MVYNQNVREQLYVGMKEIASVIKKTLGPKASNVVISGYDTVISNDGLTVAKAISFEDRIKNIAKDLLVTSAELTKDLAGDGTTSTMLLAVEFIKNILRCQKMDNWDIDEAQKDIFTKLDEISFSAQDYEILKKVAFTASGNEEISEAVAKAVMQVGVDGYIGISPTYSYKVYYEVLKGIIYDKGYISNYLANNDRVILNDAYVILVDDNINKITELEGIIYDVKKIKRDLLIIALGYSKEVIDYIIYLKKNNSLNICATLAPEYGKISSLYLDDLAIYLNAVIITCKTLYHTIDTIGKADYIEIDKKTTLIRKNLSLSEQTSVDERIAMLKEEINSNPSNDAKKRLARLMGSIANIYLPCLKEYEYILIKEKTQNAIYTTLNSLKGGAIYGGGYALNKVYWELNGNLKNILRNKGYNNYVAIVKSLLIISDTIKENKMNNGCFIEDDEDYNLALDSLINMKIIIGNALDVLKLYLSIDAIVLKDVSKVESDILF